MSANNSMNNDTNQIELLIDVPEAAKRLGVCRRTLEREVEHGHFPRPVKIGRRSLIPVAALRAYAAKLIGPIPA